VWERESVRESVCEREIGMGLMRVRERER